MVKNRREANCSLCARFYQSKAKLLRKQEKFQSRNKLQTITLLDALEEFKFDAAFGGARRDEEKARAKRKNFSFEMNLVNGTKEAKT